MAVLPGGTPRRYKQLLHGGEELKIILRSGQPLGPRELSLLYSTAQNCNAGLQGEKGVAYAQVGAAAWEPMLQKAQREVLGLGGDSAKCKRPNLLQFTYFHSETPPNPFNPYGFDNYF